MRRPGLRRSGLRRSDRIAARQKEKRRKTLAQRGKICYNRYAGGDRDESQGKTDGSIEDPESDLFCRQSAVDRLRQCGGGCGRRRTGFSARILFWSRSGFFRCGFSILPTESPCPRFPICGFSVGNARGYFCFFLFPPDARGVRKSVFVGRIERRFFVLTGYRPGDRTRWPQPCPLPFVCGIIRLSRLKGRAGFVYRSRKSEKRCLYTP